MAGRQQPVWRSGQVRKEEGGRRSGRGEATWSAAMERYLADPSEQEAAAEAGGPVVREDRGLGR